MSTNRKSLTLLFVLCVACVDAVNAGEHTRSQGADEDAGAREPDRRSEPPLTPEDVECVIGSQSRGGDGLARGALYDQWSCDWSGERLYLFTPCSNDKHCGSDHKCDTEKGRCIVRQKCRMSDKFEPDDIDPSRTNCEFINGRRGVCLNTDMCMPTCETTSDCPGVDCIALGAYKLCKIL